MSTQAIHLYGPGLKPEVSVEDFKRELRKRRINSKESHARKIAKKIAKRYKETYGTQPTAEVILSTMAVAYGVTKELVPFTVQLAEELL